MDLQFPKIRLVLDCVYGIMEILLLMRMREWEKIVIYMGIIVSETKDFLGGGSPIIGDNCDIGVGAKIIGDITIADNVTIAAGAIVNKSCSQSNVVLAGVPAKVIKAMKE